MISEEREKLRDNILLQAKYFLEEFGEFFPFGSVIMSDGELRPFGAFGEDEHPEASEVITHIQDAFNEGVLLNKYKAVAMCVDVLFTIPETNEKKDTLEIRMDSKNEVPINYYVPYNWEGKEVKFTKIYIDKGTLHIFNK